jgi:hypothetical protein
MNVGSVREPLRLGFRLRGGDKPAAGGATRTTGSPYRSQEHESHSSIPSELLHAVYLEPIRKPHPE